MKSFEQICQDYEQYRKDLESSPDYPPQGRFYYCPEAKPGPNPRLEQLQNKRSLWARVPCPRCGVTEGILCRDPDGHTRTSIHAQRIQAHDARFGILPTLPKN